MLDRNLNEEIILLKHELDTVNGTNTRLLQNCVRRLITALSALERHPHVTAERIEIVIDAINNHLKSKGTQ
jgi:hypothetical protein